MSGCICLTVLWYMVSRELAGIETFFVKNLVLFLAWLCYYISVNSKILSNRIMKYLSGISLEIYLAQMVIFRVIEKAKCLYLFGTGWISFISVWIAVVLGLIVFIEIYKCAVRLLSNKLKTA